MAERPAVFRILPCLLLFLLAAFLGRAALADNGTVRFPDGSEHAVDDAVLNLRTVSSADIPELLSCLKQMPGLIYVDLGGDTVSDPAGEEYEPVPRDLSWDDIRAIQEACPQAAVKYSFTFWGRPFTTLDTVFDLNHITMDDNGTSVKEVLPCMTQCKFLDMDFCGVDSEHMAEIRDAYPDIHVVWRIWFGADCSVRTDVERILASNLNHKLQNKNTQDLKYCTKVRLLDIGHNTLLTDFTFLEYMPDLEVAILCITGLEDLTPISGCTKLEYLEINTLKPGLDLSPLGTLVNLEHLDICYLGNVTGWEALKNLTKLKRLWIGRNTWLPEGAVEELQEALPNTVINTTNASGSGGDWRMAHNGYTERYALLREQFEYSNYGRVSSAYYNDPKYYEKGKEQPRPDHW
ncbi:MAG: hypothetical protein IKT07_01300 [Oscillospiraceae bacterium]|nr:hypothetical protein [Oscillospiraceae bacterium]